LVVLDSLLDSLSWRVDSARAEPIADMMASSLAALVALVALNAPVIDARGGKGCLGAGGCGKPLVNPCIDASGPYAKQPWCDHTKPIDERVADAVSRLSLPEKICSLDTRGCANPSLGLPDYNWWSEASSGVDNAHAATKFAYPITTAMSFNKSMWHAVGHAIGHEARALMNAGAAESTYWAPVVNLAREPRWGRNIGA